MLNLEIGWPGTPDAPQVAALTRPRSETLAGDYLNSAAAMHETRRHDNYLLLHLRAIILELILSPSDSLCLACDEYIASLRDRTPVHLNAVLITCSYLRLIRYRVLCWTAGGVDVPLEFPLMVNPGFPRRGLSHLQTIARASVVLSI